MLSDVCTLLVDIYRVRERYIYIYKERERERKTARERESERGRVESYNIQRLLTDARLEIGHHNANGLKTWLHESRCEHLCLAGFNSRSFVRCQDVNSTGKLTGLLASLISIGLLVRMTVCHPLWL